MSYWETMDFKRGDKLKETFIIDGPTYIVDEVYSQVIKTKCGRKFMKYCLRYDHPNRNKWFKR